MKAAELEALATVERSHWFYRGKRRIVRHWLRRLGVRANHDDLVIDVGAGTGVLLDELRTKYRAVGVEYSTAGLALAKKGTGAPLLAGSAAALPVESGCAAAVIALDVIEHLEDDRRAVREMTRVLRPGGFVIVNVPAFQTLWSDWDVSLGHYRRYRRRSLLDAVAHPELRVRHIAYVNWLAFLPIFLYRRWRTLFPAAGRQRLEDGIPPVWINAILETTFVWSACRPWFRPPVGVSLFCVLEKRRPGS